MNGRSSFETPNRARTRPSESSISISPALMTRLRIPQLSSTGRRPESRTSGRRDVRSCVTEAAGDATTDAERVLEGPDEARDVRNRRDPKVTAVSHGDCTDADRDGQPGSHGFVTLSATAPSAG